jgi:multimeric flavodoxin WrbA
VEAAAEAAGERGRERRVVDLAALSFRGCTGCGSCRAGFERCVLDDELTPVLADLTEASALFLSAPNYYGYVSGICKSFLDRWYSLRDGDRKLRVPEGRPLLFVLSQGHPDPAAYGAATAQFDKIFRSYGFEPRILVGAGLEKAGSAAENEPLLAEARRLGREIGTALR